MGMSDVPGCYRDTVAMVMWLLCLVEAEMEHRESCLHWGWESQKPQLSEHKGKAGLSSLHPKCILMGQRQEAVGNHGRKAH